MKFFQTKTVEIPKAFYSDLTDQAFNNCSVCEKNLMQSLEPYVIEKAISKYPGQEVHNTIFEYALCMSCMLQMRNAYSEHSMKQMNKLMQSFEPDEQKQEWLSTDLDVNKWLAKCSFTGKPIDEINDYQIIGQFLGNQMMLGELPYLISGELLEEISENLSKKTKGEIDGFLGDKLGPDPEIREALFGKKLILI